METARICGKVQLCVRKVCLSVFYEDNYSIVSAAVGLACRVAELFYFSVLLCARAVKEYNVGVCVV